MWVRARKEARTFISVNSTLQKVIVFSLPDILFFLAIFADSLRSLEAVKSVPPTVEAPARFFVYI